MAGRKYPAARPTAKTVKAGKPAASRADTVTITHPEKILFPQDGITKRELAAYYDLVADVMLPHLRNRPITMERFPSGIGAKGFLQKDVVKGFPEWLQRVEAPKKDGTVHYVLANDRRSLQWLANQNTITMHVWPSRVPRISRPDICVFDLDPSRDEPEVLRTVSLALRDLLLEHDVRSWVKTSGSKGFHIVTRLAPQTTFGASSTFADSVAAVLVQRLPKHLTLEFSKADRGGRILVDTGRNRQGATFAAAYTVRARAGAPVSAPCTWEEVERGTVHPGTFTLRTMAARLEAVGDLWADLVES
jgi:bifunctional non-homologous end joining protein LigD